MLKPDQPTSATEFHGILPPKPEMPGGLNTSKEWMLENIRINIRRHIPQVKQYDENSETAILAFSGPSLKTNLKSLKHLTAKCPLVTVNGSHNWLIEQGCTPSAQIILDARKSNAEFVKNPIMGCRYLIASQCHPDVFDRLEGYDLRIFHCDLGMGEKEILEDYYCGKNYYIIIGGSTVGLRTFMLMRMLGFKKFEVFGLDSCFINNKHHAFPQIENDNDIKAVKLEGVGREFYCAPWMLRQAYEFQDLMKHAGHLFRCRIHGNGLIANIVRAGANTKLEET